MRPIKAARFVHLVSSLMLAFMLAGCGNGEKTVQGWIEADLIFVAPDEAGRVEQLAVKEGDRVDKAAPIFTVDDDLQQADLNIVKATAANARQAFMRAEQLLKSGAGTQKAFDDTQAALREAEARLSSAQTRLKRRKVFSPVTGTVQQVYFREGEMVAAGKPVIALLPPGNLKVRFFVAQAELPKLAIGQAIKLRCDGCADGLTARISFMARSAEYTPPVIYSMEERAKLVFLIEARPDQPDKLRVGQPVDVTLEPSPVQLNRGSLQIPRLAHVLIGEPVPTSPGHALAAEAKK
jgi:HlyD family secretion protein